MSSSRYAADYVKSYLLLVFLLLLCSMATAIPEPATEFYGNATIGWGTTVPKGAVISAYDPEDNLCGRFTVVNSGHYGLLSCNGDSLDSVEDEGALDGQAIKFWINNISARPRGDNIWSSGKIAMVDLRENHPPVLNNITFPKLTVGRALNKTITASDPDNDSLFFYENTTLFEIGLIDGRINFLPEQSQLGNHTVNFSVSDGLLRDFQEVVIEITAGYCGDTICNNGENCITCEDDCGECEVPPSGSGGSSGGPTIGGDTENSNREGSGAEKEEPEETECEESWACTEWTECTASGTQTRDCIDRNNCGTDKDKPETQQECFYAGTCDDGIKNCHDGNCEEGIDCGGPCEPCTIFDEEAAYPKLPIVESPSPVCGDGKCGPFENCVCPQDCRSISKFPWLIFILIIIIATMIMLISKNFLIYKGKKHPESEKTYRIYDHRINVTYIVFIGVVIALMLNSYITWFCLEKLIVYMMLTVLGAVLILGALALYYAYSTRYDESRNMEHAKSLIQEHQARLSEIVDVEGRLIRKIINQLLKRIYSLYQSKDPLVREFRELIKVYNLLKKFEEKGLNETLNEKSLALLIKELGDNQAFRDKLDTEEKKRVMEELDIVSGYLARKSELISKINDLQAKLKSPDAE